jgi:hypothetical protein
MHRCFAYVYQSKYLISILPTKHGVGGRGFMKIKSILYIFAAMTVLLALAVAPVAAAGHAQVVKLIEKTPVAEGPYIPILNGAFGSIMYQDDKFVFDGHKLDPGVDYTLISYSEPWGTEIVILGTGKSTAQGNLLIKGGAVGLVYNSYPTPTSNEYSGTGAKIWLVPSSDLAGTFFNAWNPQNYLFETSLII